MKFSWCVGTISVYFACDVCNCCLRVYMTPISVPTNTRMCTNKTDKGLNKSGEGSAKGSAKGVHPSAKCSAKGHRASVNIRRGD